MSELGSLGPLNVGVVIPTAHPTEGGGFEFQQTVFAEVVRRINSFDRCKSSLIRYIPVATQAQNVSHWQLDPEASVNLVPSQSLRIRSAIFRRLRRVKYSFSPAQWSENLAARATVRLLADRVHVLWSLSPAIITDQLPFILTVWDLQHRLQPFFPEVSRSGEWESRQSHCSTITRKGFLYLVGTQRGAHELNSFFGTDPSRILVNPFPCPPPLFLKEQALQKVMHEFELHPLKFIVLPAQFWPHKNHLAALLALRQLLDEGHSFKLVFTGSDKGSLPSINNLVRRFDLNGWVVNAGFVDRSTLAALYSSSLALVYPSYFGPDNIPPLEAMSYNTPAIVAGVPGSLEQYGDSVLRFDPNQPSQIVECVLRLLNEPGLRDCLIQRGGQLIKQLTPAAYVDRIEAELHQSALALFSASLYS